jgi:hypothetical protein
MAVIDKTLASKSRQHTVYKTADGTRVPGVTTVLGVLAKPALIAWANRMGLQGIDTTKYVDAAAKAGTAAHEMIQCHLTGMPFDSTQYPQDLLDLAVNGFIKYLDWEKGHKIEDVHSEMGLVSESWKYGGTIDMYCKLDGVPTLVDFKTNSSGIYGEMMHQVAGGYRQLLGENGYLVHQVLIIRLGKSDNMDLEARMIGDWDLHWDIFRECLHLYNLLKKVA